MKNKWIHWTSKWKHGDGRKITCEGDYKRGEVDFSQIESNLEMAKAGFKEEGK